MATNVVSSLHYTNKSINQFLHFQEKKKKKTVRQEKRLRNLRKQLKVHKNLYGMNLHFSQNSKPQVLFLLKQFNFACMYFKIIYMLTKEKKKKEK